MTPDLSLPSPGLPLRVGTVVVGGGQAGLAVGQQLAARGQDFIILDAEPRPGEAWRRRWDSLRLFTPAAYSGLPGLPFPAAPMHLPTREEVADYLARYASHFALPIQHDTRVESVTRTDDGARFVVRAGGARGSVVEADQVVVATGPFHRPAVPPVAAALAPEIVQAPLERVPPPVGPAGRPGARRRGGELGGADRPRTRRDPHRVARGARHGAPAAAPARPRPVPVDVAADDAGHGGHHARPPPPRARPPSGRRADRHPGARAARGRRGARRARRGGPGRAPRRRGGRRARGRSG